MEKSIYDETLMPAEQLGFKQDEYLKRVHDEEMQQIIKVVNAAYKTPDRFVTFDRISDLNTGKLRLAGYKVEYIGDQRDGYWYRVSW